MSEEHVTEPIETLTLIVEDPPAELTKKKSFITKKKIAFTAAAITATVAAIAFKVMGSNKDETNDDFDDFVVDEIEPVTTDSTEVVPETE